MVLYLLAMPITHQSLNLFIKWQLKHFQISIKELHRESKELEEILPSREDLQRLYGSNVSAEAAGLLVRCNHKT